MATYNWQQADWPDFTYTLDNIVRKLLDFAEMSGHITGILKGLPTESTQETIIELMVTEAIKTSEIEGEYFSRKDVMSSIKNNLRLNLKPQIVQDKNAEGVASLMTNVRSTWEDELTQEVLFSWHRMLLPQAKGIKTGSWRTHEEPMQVVSGAIGKEKIHYEAPPSANVPKEMQRFIKWFNDTSHGKKQEIAHAPVRAAIAHLYFETIHPFEDGNGRIGRAIAEKALSQGIGRPALLSLSRTIEADKTGYYNALKKAQQSNEISSWINYFVDIVLLAQKETQEQIDFTLKKTKLFDRIKDDVNERQIKVIKKMLEQGMPGFKGGMNASKYVSITKVSKATATRDLQDLRDKGIFVLAGAAGGRSTSYNLTL